jgi:hypothetical protein
MESKKINQLATELAPDLSDLTIIGDPTTGISKKITLSQMASLFTGTVEEYANLAAFPLVGVADTIYIALDTNIIYRYDTSLSAYVILSPNIINSLVFSDANGFDGTITLVGSVATLTITTALTSGSVPFIGASGALTQDNSNLFFDDTNNRLGIATASPTTPLDVFGSGIIGRLNATSTNNAYLGFASNGTNKWSAGNVQSDHRFRIFSEANSAELITILQTGEFGIGIANPLTKLHIDGGATALIANLDADVSVAKTLSFRSDNSNRFNIEVSGTESGSNVGADLFIRTFTDAGSLIETPLSIVRSTGVTTIKSLTLTNVLSVANGGTGIATLTAGRIPFGNGTSAFNSSGNLFWDNTNIRLGINTSSPNAKLDIADTYVSDTTTQVMFRDNTGGGLLFGGTGGAVKWLQSQDYTGAATYYSLALNPRGGNVLIGKTSSTGGLLQVSNGTNMFNIDNDANGPYITAVNNANTVYKRLTIDASEILFDISAAEKARLTSGGYLKASNNGSYNDITGGYHELVANTANSYTAYISNIAASPASTYIVDIQFKNSTPNNTSARFLNCDDSTNNKAIIYSDGTYGSRTGTYGPIISDEKYKTEIQSANSQWEDIKNLRVVNFKYKEDVELEGEKALRQIGFIAQEVEKISPNLVYISSERDSEETWKSVKTSIIEIKAIKALQEAMEKIEILEEKVKQLELK